MSTCLHIAIHIGNMVYSYRGTYVQGSIVACKHIGDGTLDRNFEVPAGASDAAL